METDANKTEENNVKKTEEDNAVPKITSVIKPKMNFGYKTKNERS